MELHQFRIFESVSRHLNISSAAAELGMSQPAASLQLKRLEQECKVQFYTRNNHGVSLTPEGQAFLEAVRPILAQLDKVDQDFRAENDRHASRPFVVGGSNTLSATVLPEILLEFKRRNPSVNLLVETSDSHRMADLVQKRRVEVALVTTPCDLPGCECEPYLEHEAVAFAAPDNPLCRKTLTLEELVRIPLVVRRGSSTVSELERRGYNLKFAAQFSAIEAVKTAVRGGMGVGLLFRSRLESELARGEVRIIDVPDLRFIKLKSFIVYGKRPRQSANVLKFLQILRGFRH
ncbi:MAG: LysR family transcriptional regulator [Pirellulaceae bacterium]